jgi:hypothetical protein
MIAFYRQNGYLVKVYEHGTDWQCITSDGKEYWFSVWQADKKASLTEAVRKSCLRDSAPFVESEIIYK